MIGLPSSQNVALAFRAGAPADHAFLWTLHIATMRSYVDATWGWNDDDQRKRFDDTFAPHRLTIILIDEEPGGVLKVERRETDVFVSAIEIAPRWQRRGLGTRILLDVIERAGDVPVTLSVLKANPARRLYGRLGFEVDGETETHYAMRHVPRL